MSGNLSKNAYKAEAKAPANIAFIKYWGKRDEKLNIPMNGSVSMNLSEAYTTTSVEFNKSNKCDLVYFDESLMQENEAQKVIIHLDRIRKIAKINYKAKVYTKNNFPKGSGIASSASGFAALTYASCKALELGLSLKEMSILARKGSGSAARSTPDGFVEWIGGKSDNTSYARSIFPHDHWDILDIIAVVSEGTKKISSSEGHVLAKTSPFYEARLKNMPEKINELKKSIKDRDFSKFGSIVEEEAINMHAVMMTSTPPLFYLSPKTLEVMYYVMNLREEGTECYFTLDAGPNVHIICEGKNKNRLIGSLRKIRGIKKIIVNKNCKGASLIKS